MPTRLKDPRFAGLIALFGLVAGLCLWVLTIGVTRGHLSGDGWSLSGNGALIIPFGIGPALVAGGWAAIIAALIPAPDPERRGPPLWSIAALILLPITLIAGCEAGSGVLPG